MERQILDFVFGIGAGLAITHSIIHWIGVY